MIVVKNCHRKRPCINAASVIVVLPVESDLHVVASITCRTANGTFTWLLPSYISPRVYPLRDRF
jgi:hypothetical protein